jgi:hypothetical protein
VSTPSPARDLTVSLHEDVLKAMDIAVSNGAADDISAFVERALLRELQKYGGTPGGRRGKMLPETRCF